MGAKLQLTFFHLVVGIPIIPDKLHYVARVGTKVGTGVEMDPHSTFCHTTATHVPALLSFMKVSKEEEFVDLLVESSKPKKKLKTYTVLTPAITRVIKESNMTPCGVFLDVMNHLKATMTVAAAKYSPVKDSTTSSISSRRGRSHADAGTDAEAEAVFLKKIGDPYKAVLRFIWVVHSLPDVITSPVTAPLQDA